MSTTQTSHLRQIASRVKEIFAELNYAPRRLWEVTAEMPGREQPRKRQGSSKRRRSVSGAASS